MAGLLHVLPRSAWEGLAGESHLRPPSLDREGFVHLCSEAQLEGVLERWFPGRTGLLALELDPSLLEPELRWEELPHGRFPHLLGALNLSAVVGVRTIDPPAESARR